MVKTGKGICGDAIGNYKAYVTTTITVNSSLYLLMEA